MRGGPWTAVAVPALWAIGAFLRLHHLEAMEFKRDEGEALVLATRLLSNLWSSSEPWPDHGMLSSARIANAPLFTWMVALFWSLTHHPVGVARCIAIANAASLVPLWYWARRQLDEPRALLTLAIISVSPFAVLFSRKIWTQDLLFPGLIAVLWGIELLRTDRLWRGIAVMGLGVLLVGQLHQSGAIAIALLPVALAIHVAIATDRASVVQFRQPSSMEVIAIAIVVIANAFFWLPYLAYLTAIDWTQLPAREMAGVFSGGLLWRLILEIAPRNLVSLFWVDQDAFAAHVIRGAVLWISIGLGAPLGVYGVWRWFRAPRTMPIVGIWWWLVIVAFALARIPGHFFYVLILAPLPALLAAGAFDGPLPNGWFTRGIVWWRWTYVVSLLVLTVLTTTWLADRGGSRGDYGVTFELREGQAKYLSAQLRSPSVPITERAQIRFEDGSTLVCGTVPGVVLWLVEWIDARPTPSLEQFRLCEGWIGVGSGEREYRWAVYQLP